MNTQVKQKLVELFNKLTNDQLNSNDLSIYIHTNKEKIFSVGLIQHDTATHPHAMLDATYLKSEFDNANDVLCIKALKSDVTGFDAFRELYSTFLRDYFDKYITLDSSESNDYNYDYKQCLRNVNELK